MYYSPLLLFSYFSLLTVQMKCSLQHLKVNTYIYNRFIHGEILYNTLLTTVVSQALSCYIICLLRPTHSRLIHLVVQREDQNLAAVVEHLGTPSHSQYPVERYIASQLQ